MRDRSYTITQLSVLNIHIICTLYTHTRRNNTYNTVLMCGGDITFYV